MSIESLDHVVLGVLYDFMGFLTTRKERIILSSSDNASPAVEVIKEFCDKRGVEDCEPLEQWEGRLAKVTKKKIRGYYELKEMATGSNPVSWCTT